MDTRLMVCTKYSDRLYVPKGVTLEAFIKKADDSTFVLLENKKGDQIVLNKFEISQVQPNPDIEYEERTRLIMEKKKSLKQ